MAAKGGCIDFMFLGPPPPYPAAGSATETTTWTVPKLEPHIESELRSGNGGSTYTVVKFWKLDPLQVQFSSLSRTPSGVGAPVWEILEPPLARILGETSF